MIKPITVPAYNDVFGTTTIKDTPAYNDVLGVTAITISMGIKGVPTLEL